MRAGLKIFATVIIAGMASATPRAAAQAVAMRSSEGTAVADSIAEAARRFGTPAAWIRAIMHVESAGDQRAVSSKGAMGLMQLMPDTWADLRARYALGDDPFDPHDNILAGSAYLRELHDRYGSPGFLAAYNAGPGRYEDYRDRHSPLPSETLDYVAALLPLIGGDAGQLPLTPLADPLGWMRAPLFIVQPVDRNFGDPAPSNSFLNSAPAAHGAMTISPHADGLFVALPAGKLRP